MNNARAFCMCLLTGCWLLHSAPAQAKPWKGIAPGKSTQTDVTKKFGKPALEKKDQGPCATLASYQGDQAIAGARQAQFCFDGSGKLLNIIVFPETALDKETVQEAFGEDYRKRLTDDFVVYWHYEKDGLVVFFDKEGKAVSAVQYTEAKAGAAKKPSAGGAEEKQPD